MAEHVDGGAADSVAFEVFVDEHSRRLWQAVVPIAGTDIAADATADALAYAWEHWAEVRAMGNPGDVYLEAIGDTGDGPG